jgi:hypothetical protein
LLVLHPYQGIPIPASVSVNCTLRYTARVGVHPKHTSQAWSRLMFFRLTGAAIAALSAIAW